MVRRDVLVLDANRVAPDPFRQPLARFSEVAAGAFSSPRTVGFVEEWLFTPRRHVFQEVLIDEMVVQGDLAIVAGLRRIRVEANDFDTPQHLDVRGPELCHFVDPGARVSADPGHPSARGGIFGGQIARRRLESGPQDHDGLIFREALLTLLLFLLYADGDASCDVLGQILLLDRIVQRRFEGREIAVPDGLRIELAAVGLFLKQIVFPLDDVPGRQARQVVVLDECD
jgi:hypothetical protein